MAANDPATARLQRLSADTRAVARAIALLWTWRTRAAILETLVRMDSKMSTGKPFTQASVRDSIHELKTAGLLLDHPHRQGFFQLADDTRAALYRELLDSMRVGDLRAALQPVGYVVPAGRYTWQPQPLSDTADAVALVRLELFSGSDAKALDAMRKRLVASGEWDTVLHPACFEGFDGALFERIEPSWRWALLYTAVQALCEGWRDDMLPFASWGLQRLEAGDPALPRHVRQQLAELLLHRGDVAGLEHVLTGDTGGAADALRAAALVQQARWAEAQALFETALRKLQVELSARKRLLPSSLAWFYPLALLAQQTPAHLELARKFCIGESGSRKPDPRAHWGIWAHAISVRLGDAMPVPHVFDLCSAHGRYVDRDDLWRCMLRAWLGRETADTAASRRHGVSYKESLATLRQRLQACGFDWLDAQVEAATIVSSGGDAPAHFFAAGRTESWRAVLLSLQALGAQSTADPDAKTGRLVWAISIDGDRGIEAIQPLEQKHGPRGWSKPKAVSLARLAGNERLDPWDAKVTRAIRRDRYATRGVDLDLAAAIIALIGHPAVVFADDPETLVDVVEGAPELEVVREGERFAIRVTPALRADKVEEFAEFGLDDSERHAGEAMRAITVVRDSPQRLRVIRLTPAQRRATHLLAGRFSVPAAALDELQQTLRALAGHFQIHSDDAAAAREVEAEARLRAELSPSGDGLMLRLVVAPLGPEGPRLMPGAGRVRVMAAVKGESIGAQRNLQAERAHLDEVVAHFEFLDPPARDDVVCEWLVQKPDHALELVERLPQLPAVHAVDWPRGKPVRVVAIGPPAVVMKVKTERDWFRLQGEARLDDGLVFRLEALLAASASGSRFIPMGKGVYAALTRDLRDRLNELAAVAEAHAGELRVPHLAAAWLDDTLAGSTVERDAAFAGRIERLRAAQGIVPPLPGGLQTHLRPYQEDGFVWAMRLAGAGFGACLADDMGLGKTIQTLAVLLARGHAGPALVVAPTSVCGNWVAEMQRFAPALNPIPFGDGDRVATIAAAGPRDVVIASYTLMQQSLGAFKDKTWHTLVADEAQAVKNASAKRSVALFELAAEFRIALSGTPIENRLAELWSIMRFCNPGLLGTIARFNERFAAPIERDRDRDAQRMLRRLIAPFVLRRTKSEVLHDLPARTELVLTIAPEPAEAAHYEALRRVAVAAAESAAAHANAGQAHVHVLAQLTRMRRAACDPRLVSPNLGIVGAKVRAFAELAAELVANGHKALVFSQFVDFLTILRAPLDEAGIRYQYLDGATPAEERTRRVAAFQAGEGDLFLISLKAGGFGLNLTAADYVVITDPWWNPAAEDQAMGRAHRIGQSRPVTVYRLVAKGTLEERIVELHHDKRALADRVLADSGESAALPSTSELIALIRDS